MGLGKGHGYRHLGACTENGVLGMVNGKLGACESEYIEPVARMGLFYVSNFINVSTMLRSLFVPPFYF